MPVRRVKATSVAKGVANYEWGTNIRMVGVMILRNEMKKGYEYANEYEYTNEVLRDSPDA